MSVLKHITTNCYLFFMGGQLKSLKVLQKLSCFSSYCVTRWKPKYVKSNIIQNQLYRCFVQILYISFLISCHKYLKVCKLLLGLYINVKFLLRGSTTYISCSRSVPDEICDQNDRVKHTVCYWCPWWGPLQFWEKPCCT